MTAMIQLTTVAFNEERVAFVNPDHIVSVTISDDGDTFIELVTGRTFRITQAADDVAHAITHP